LRDATVPVLFSVTDIVLASLSPRSRGRDEMLQEFQK
jgi:hypothetical protein